MSIRNEGQVGLIIGQRTHVPLPVKVRDPRSLEERIAAAHERRRVKSPIVLGPAPAVAAPVKVKPARTSKASKPKARKPRAAAPSPRGFRVDTDDVVTRYQAGASINEIAKALDCAWSTVRDALARAEVTRRVDHGGNKTLDIADQVHALAADGLSHQAIADRLGVSRRTVERRLTKPQTGETA